MYILGAWAVAHRWGINTGWLVIVRSHPQLFSNQSPTLFLQFNLFDPKPNTVRMKHFHEISSLVVLLLATLAGVQSGPAGTPSCPSDVRCVGQGSFGSSGH
ncbi:hypothetical protein PTTG_29341 [Puccinia triticina 1-1 BBBD Race 1]|uniref:Uncharacterized protein n=1 Tax=Puccinia triticina (isolate 1-1 / race 1 (BBBD)) TaxID=630390 RepID=A0A180G5B4_PUCT1|nr:hypothetical protein PTTG_29341 [Puccinia triticina 1-1 BBBD Race 1]